MGTDRTPASQALYRFELCTLGPATGTLTRRRLRIKLQEQPFRFLVLMLEKRGTVVSRAAIREVFSFNHGNFVLILKNWQPPAYDAGLDLGILPGK